MVATEVLIFAGIAVLIVSLIITLFALIYYSGLFESVEVGAGNPPLKDAVVAYKFERGPYQNAGTLFSEVARLAPLCKCVGIYYDDPKVVPSDKLRYAVGAVLAEGKVKPEKEIVDSMLSEGYKIINLPLVTNCVKTTFPYTNTLSIFVAVMKVYPRLSAYITEHKLCAYPFLELYESDIIHFFAPLARQDEFYVKESHDPELERIYEDNEDYEHMSSSYRDSSVEGSPSGFDSSCSRSESAFSSGSRLLMDTVEESDSEFEEKEEIQDQEVTSSVELMKESKPVPAAEEEGKKDADVSTDGQQSLMDSGLCSGRDSTSPPDSNLSMEAMNDQASEGNVSTSSFEEIQMDESLIGVARVEENVTKKQD